MNKGMTLAAGAGVGAALMYVFDPDRGNRRRALMRDRVAHVAAETGDTVGAAARDMRNRVRGAVSETTGRLRRERVSDEQLRARVRSAVGRVVSHPSSIIVTAHDGAVVVSGPILAREAGSMLARARSVRGVHSVENRLDVHETADGVPGLQGGRVRRRIEGAADEERWSPVTRVLVGAGGGALAFYGVRNEGAMAAVVGLMGLGMVTRASTDVGVRQLTRLAPGRRTQTLREAINVAAPLDMVFAFWKDPGRLSRVVSHVREVRETAPGSSHWVVDGPGGVPTEWETAIIREVPNALLEWKSTGDSGARHTGAVRFRELSDGFTHVAVTLSYPAPAGVARRGTAEFFGANPAQQVRDDLRRMKTALEPGAIPGGTERSEPLAPVRDDDAGSPMS
ncbi:MAG TPA: SRPBCC family protein [Gemmatimonadaceae bacterium]|nr:SRPBCC family protein [Gemmatimonadaceae bacterium]